MATTLPHQILKEKYFYPVTGTKGVYIGTQELIPRDKTPARMVSNLYNYLTLQY